MRILDEMKAERARQIEKWGRQKLSLRVWAWVWLEEVGEYYHARLEMRAAEKEYDEKYRRFNYLTKEGLDAARRMIKWRQEPRKELVQMLTVVWAFAAQWRPWHGLWRI